MTHIRTLMLTALALPLAALAAPEQPDTLVSIPQPHQVIVTESPDGITTVMVNGKEGQPGYVYTYTTSMDGPGSDENQLSDGTEFKLPFGRSHTSKKVNFRFLRGILFGMAWNTSHYPGIKNGWEAMITEVAGVSWTPSRMAPTFAIGLGVGWRFWAAQRNWMMARDEAGALQLAPVEPEAQGDKVCRSRIQSFSLTVPVTITQPIYKDFAVQVGALVNFNTYTTAHTKVEQADGIRINTDIQRLHQRPLTIEWMASLGIREYAAVYVKYSPMGMFTAPNGPKFKSLSVGLNLSF